MLTIRSLNGATDCGTRAPSLAGGNISTRSAARVARVRRGSEFSHFRLALELAPLPQILGLRPPFPLITHPHHAALVGRRKTLAASRPGTAMNANTAPRRR